jgi:hypothetical protein
MLKTIITAALTLCVGMGTLVMSGCESDAQTGALIGTAAGAGIGQAIGHNTGGTLIGAGVGAAGGYLIGNESDKNKTKKENQQQMSQIQAEQNTVTVWITNTNGSKIPVKLRKDGPNFIGPRGEIYQSMPSEESLKMVYGFRPGDSPSFPNQPKSTTDRCWPVCFSRPWCLRRKILKNFPN